MTKIPISCTVMDICKRTHEQLDVGKLLSDCSGTHEAGRHQSCKECTYHYGMVLQKLPRDMNIYGIECKTESPTISSTNPDLCSSITTYMKEHLAELSIELLSEYIHETIVPKLVSEILEENTAQM